jgi:hypothetical protein
VFTRQRVEMAPSGGAAAVPASVLFLTGGTDAFDMQYYAAVARPLTDGAAVELVALPSKRLTFDAKEEADDDLWDFFHACNARATGLQLVCDWLEKQVTRLLALSWFSLRLFLL